jgi:ABC-type polysaccharide/polyol phosphate transport system ATPase subunit
MAVRIGEVRLSGVSRRYRVLHERNATLKETLLRRRRVVATDNWVLREVDLDVPPGQALGIVGRNGIGKSTLLKLIAGVLPPQSGTVEVGGVVAPLLELGAGFHPDFTGRENTFMQGALLGLDEREVAARLADIVAFAELEDFMDMPVRAYSSGMFMRLAFSIAAHVEADVMLLDEVLAVGDASFQRKCRDRIQRFREAGGTLLFVSHNQRDVEEVCDRAILLDAGRIVADGTPSSVFAEYGQRMARQRPSSPADTEAAWSGGAPFIRAVRLGGETGSAGTVPTGDDLLLEIEVDPADRPLDILVEVSFHADDGLLVSSLRTRPEDLEGVENEGFTLLLRVPRLPFLGGRYYLDVSLRSFEQGEILHRLASCAEVVVPAAPDAQGLVSLDPTWTVKRQISA